MKYNNRVIRILLGENAVPREFNGAEDSEGINYRAIHSRTLLRVLVSPLTRQTYGIAGNLIYCIAINHNGNISITEFWEDHFKCRYPNSSQTPYNNYTNECNTTEKLSKQNTTFEDQLQFVSDAVLAFAYAFR